MDKQVGLFVDASNLYGDVRDGNARLDYNAALQFARRLGILRHANIYAVRCNGDKDKGFLLAMKTVGFTRIVARHPRIRPDGQIKSDADTALAMDLIEAIVKEELDAVVLMSGDSDFTCLVERLVERGIEVTVVGPDRSTAWEIIVAANRFLYVSEVPGFVQPVIREATPEPAPAMQRPG